MLLAGSRNVHEAPRGEADVALCLPPTVEFREKLHGWTIISPPLLLG
jgi:hypothetical protein